MRTWKITLEYEGTKYSGWQEQNNARTVQGQLRQAAQDFFGSEVELQGAGRTDAGVHAYAQVAHLRLRAPESGKRRWNPVQIKHELNDRLPADVSVLHVEEADNNFHARHDALTRTYVYRIATRRTAFFKRHVWWVKQRLDTGVMAYAAAKLVGRHDFVRFRAADATRPDESTVVVVDSATIEMDGDVILFRITASHFVWRMVRRIVGVLVKLGTAEITAEQFDELLNGGAPSLDVAAWTAPASGLFLERVTYKPEAKGLKRVR